MKHNSPKIASVHPTIYPVKGGVHPPFNKKCSTRLPIAQPDMPETLVVPVVQHIGDMGLILVSAGQTVHKGQPLTELPEGLGAMTHAPTSGTVQAIEERAVPHASGLSAVCVIIATDGKDDWGEYSFNKYPDYTSIESLHLCESIRTAGLVGMGGAAFPSAAKLAASSQHGLDTLIINAAECEPYISCDDMLMRNFADEVITGINILRYILKPKKCLIGIEANKPQAIAALRQAINKTTDNPDDAGISIEKGIEKGVEKGIKIITIPTIYPSGDEKQLIRILTGKKLAKNNLPFNHGILVHNVGTVHSIYRAIVQGKPLLSRIVTVTGRGIQQPQNFQALIGTSFSHLIQQAGGYTNKAERLIMGGPMMGYRMKTDALPIIKATNCILVLPKTDLPYSTDMAMPCIRCGKCMEVCPVDLLPQQLYWYARSGEFAKAQDYKLADCIECGCCSYVCPSEIPLVSYYRYAKSEIRTGQENQQKVDVARERFEFREYRLERTKQERDAKRAEHKAALQAKRAKKGANTDKTDAIKAAVERAKQKKADRGADGKIAKKNIKNLTPAQQKQIDEIDQRRTRERQQTRQEDA